MTMAEHGFCMAVPQHHPFPGIDRNNGNLERIHERAEMALGLEIITGGRLLHAEPFRNRRADGNKEGCQQVKVPETLGKASSSAEDASRDGDRDIDQPQRNEPQAQAVAAQGQAVPPAGMANQERGGDGQERD
jgi:hypothetical protein